MGFIVLENIRKAQTEIIFIFRRLAAERQRQKSKIVHLQALSYHFDWLDSFASFLIFFYTLRKSFVWQTFHDDIFSMKNFLNPATRHDSSKFRL